MDFPSPDFPPNAGLTFLTNLRGPGSNLTNHMKKIIIRVGIVVVVLLVVVLAVVFFSLNSIVKKGVETVGPKLTQVEVRLGAADLSPFSGSGTLTKLFVGNPTGYKTASAIEVGSVKVAVEVGSVMSDTIVVDEINIQVPEITLEGTLSGNNLSKILDNLKTAAGGDQKSATPAPTASGKPAKKFFVKHFVMDGGKVNLSLNLPVLGGKSLSAPLPPLHVDNIGTAQNGVSAAELVQTVMTPLLASVTTVAESAVAGVGKDLQNAGKQGADQLKGAAKSVTDMFKK